MTAGPKPNYDALRESLSQRFRKNSPACPPQRGCSLSGGMMTDTDVEWPDPADDPDEEPSHESIPDDE